MQGGLIPKAPMYRLTAVGALSNESHQGGSNLGEIMSFSQELQHVVFFGNSVEGNILLVPNYY